MIRFAVLILLAVQLLQSRPAAAHEMRPAYLDLREVSQNRFDVLWKVPAQGEMRLGLHIQLPPRLHARGGTLEVDRIEFLS